ncbi:MAG TPA: DUF192 domain-containing protein [Polyangiaceae bacterium]|jgi:hypothetical protein
MRGALLLVAAMLALPGCDRTPAEDFPTRAPGSALTSSVPPAASSAVLPAVGPPPAALAGRCVRATPVSAPPAVSPGPAAGCPADPEGNQKVPVARVAFPDAAGAGAAVDAEVVSSEHDTMRGLMYRRSMPEEHAMLFDLRVRDDHQFWMHNTCIPLDLLYVDEDGLVVGIVENAPTLDDTSRGVGCPSRYVLEVNAGWSRRHGVKAGQRMTIPPEAK